MRPAVDFSESVARSQAYLRDALEQWDASDLQASERVCDFLRRASDELERARRGFDAGPRAGRAKATLHLAWIRSDAARLTRLIEASQAFHRGLALRMCADSAEDFQQPSAPAIWGGSECRI